MKKIISLVLSIILLFSFATTAFASELSASEKAGKEITAAEDTIIEVSSTTEKPSQEDFSTSNGSDSLLSAQDFVNAYYAQTGSMPRANETYTYETGKMSTNTWGIKWSAKVSFVLGQRANGSYYFKSINSGSVTLYENYLILALMGTVLANTSDRYHSILNSGSTIRISMKLNVEVWTSGAIVPMRYSENHHVDIPISNVTP